MGIVEDAAIIMQDAKIPVANRGAEAPTLNNFAETKMIVEDAAIIMQDAKIPVANRGAEAPTLNNFAETKMIVEDAAIIKQDAKIPVANSGAKGIHSATAETALVIAEAALGVSLGLKTKPRKV